MCISFNWANKANYSRHELQDLVEELAKICVRSSHAINSCLKIHTQAWSPMCKNLFNIFTDEEQKEIRNEIFLEIKSQLNREAYCTKLKGKYYLISEKTIYSKDVKNVLCFCMSKFSAPNLSTLQNDPVRLHRYSKEGTMIAYIFCLDSFKYFQNLLSLEINFLHFNGVFTLFLIQSPIDALISNLYNWTSINFKFWQGTNCV